MRAARALGRRLLRSAGTRGAQLLHRTASRRALKRLASFGIDRAVARHIAEHFTMVAGKVSHSVFVTSLRSTQAVTALVKETLKKASASPILSKTDSGALAWVFEAELGRTIGTAGSQALTRLRVVVDLQGRLVTAFPIRSFTSTMTIRSLRGVRVTVSAALAVLAIEGAYENEAAAATEARKNFDERNEPSWWEYLLPWGPSSTLGFHPNPSRIHERAVAVIETIEEATGEALSREERAEVKNDVRIIWSTSPSKD